MKKIHIYLSFLFQFQSFILFLPSLQYGISLPSIALLNSTAAITGLHCDLNHSFSLFQNMANITLTDCACSFNSCILPTIFLPTPPSSAQLSQKICQSWQHAISVLWENDLLLFPTNFSSLLFNTTALKHIANITDSYSTFSNLPKAPHFPLSCLFWLNVCIITNFGSFSVPDIYSIKFMYKSLIFPSPTFSNNWQTLLTWFANITPFLSSYSSLGPYAFFSRQTWVKITENYLITITSLCSMFCSCSLFFASKTILVSDEWPHIVSQT